MPLVQSTSLLRLLRSITLGLVLIAVGFVFGGYLYVNQAGGLRRLLETELTIMAGNAPVSVGDARFGFAAGDYPVFIGATDIVITIDDSQIRLPSIDVRFGLGSIFDGHPKAITMRGVKLDLVRQQSGWSGSSELLFLSQLVARAPVVDTPPERGKAAAGRIAGIEHIAVETDRLSLSDATGLLSNVVFSNIYIDAFAPSDDVVSVSMRASRQNESGANDGSFTIAVDGWSGDGSFQLDVSASNLQTADIAGYIDGVPKALQNPGHLSGHIRVEIQNGVLQRFDADVDLEDGTLGLPETAQSADFQTAQLIGDYERKSGRLRVKRAELALSNASSLSFSGSVAELLSFSPIIDGVLKANKMSLKSVFDSWPSSILPELKQSVQSRLNGGIFNQIEVGFEGTYRRAERQLKISKLDVQSQFSSVRASLAVGQYKRMVATLDGAVDVVIGVNGRLETARLGVTVADGAMLLDGHANSITVTGGSLDAALRGEKINLEKFHLDLGKDGTFDLDGSLVVGKGWTLQDLELGLKVPDMDVQTFAALWPEWAAPATRNWIDSHILSGRVQEANLGLQGDLDTPGDVRKVNQVRGDVKLRNAAFVWQKGAPPLAGVDADLQWNNDEFTANILTGQIDHMTIQRGRIVIAPVLERVKKDAAITFTAKGDMKTALTLAGHAGLKKFGMIDFATVDSSGEVEVAAEVTVPLGKSASFQDSFKKVDLTVRNGAFDHLPWPTTVNNAELVINVDAQKSQITGTADLFGATSEFSLQIDRKTNQLVLLAQALPSSRLADAVAHLTGLDIGGKLGGRLSYKGDPMLQDASVGLRLELQDADINVPQIGWRKTRAEDGRATMSMTLRNGVLTKLTDVDVDAGSLTAQGQVIFSASGQVQAALFQRAAWQGNDLRDLIIESGAQSSWKVGATARRVDLSPLRANKGVSGGKAIAFDFTGEEIVIDDKITLSGQLVGRRDERGQGTVEFLGSLLVKDTPLITEGKLDIGFGPAGETMTGAGLIGGAEAEIQFKHSAGALPALVIETKNAGRVLAGLEITDTVRGGLMRLVTTFNDSTFQSHDTDIKITKFSVVEAPTALRIFSVLSPVGLYSLVEGDGTKFRHGEARFETRGEKVNITRLTGYGDALAVAVVGIYDRSNRTIELSGNLVPASLLNKILTELPILGDIVTGVDKKGILVTEFKMTGSLDKPKTQINPVSSLAPGLLRDLLSPDWIGKEEERLFGKRQGSVSSAEKSPEQPPVDTTP